MIAAALCTALLSASLAADGDAQATASYRAAMRAFATGEFERALRELSTAERSATSDTLRADIALAQGRCHAALENFAAVERDFQRALDADPEARLDPSVVHPTVVAMLDGLRVRLRGTLSVDSEPPGAEVQVDGAAVGQTPYSGPISIGRHVVTVRRAAGEPPTSREAVIRRDRPTRLTFTLSPAPTPPAVHASEPDMAASRWLLLAELRADVDPTAGVSVEVGAGGGGRHWLVSAHAFLGAAPGATLRVSGRLPSVLGPAGLYASLDGVVFFAQPTIPGVGASAGVMLRATPWLELFVEGSGRLLADSERYFSRYALACGGARLVVP